MRARLRPAPSGACRRGHTQVSALGVAFRFAIDDRVERLQTVVARVDGLFIAVALGGADSDIEAETGRHSIFLLEGKYPGPPKRPRPERDLSCVLASVSKDVACAEIGK